MVTVIGMLTILGFGTILLTFLTLLITILTLLAILETTLVVLTVCIDFGKKCLAHTYIYMACIIRRPFFSAVNV